MSIITSLCYVELVSGVGRMLLGGRIRRDMVR